MEWGRRAQGRAGKAALKLKDTAGQATVEAAFLLPVLLGGVLLLVQPGILLYDRMVMEGAAAEGCRLLATTPAGDPDGQCEAFIRRRLGAVPQQDNFHVHSGGCSWDIVLEGGEASGTVRVTIRNQAKPLPLIGFAASALGAVGDSGTFGMEVSASQPTQPGWVASAAAGSAPEAWPGAWSE